MGRTELLLLLLLLVLLVVMMPPHVLHQQRQVRLLLTMATAAAAAEPMGHGEYAEAQSVAQKGITWVLGTVSTAATNAMVGYRRQGTGDFTTLVAPALSKYNLLLCAAMERFSRAQGGLHFMSGDLFERCFWQTNLLDSAGSPFACAVNAGTGSAEQALLCSAACSVLKVCGVMQAVQPATADKQSKGYHCKHCC